MAKWRLRDDLDLIANVKSEAIKVEAPQTGECAGRPLYIIPFVVDRLTGRTVSDISKTTEYSPALSLSGSDTEARVIQLASKVPKALCAVYVVQKHSAKLFGAGKIKQMLLFYFGRLPDSVATALEALGEFACELGKGRSICDEKSRRAEMTLTRSRFALISVLRTGNKMRFKASSFSPAFATRAKGDSALGVSPRCARVPRSELAVKDPDASKSSVAISEAFRFRLSFTTSLAHDTKYCHTTGPTHLIGYRAPLRVGRKNANIDRRQDTAKVMREGLTGLLKGTEKLLNVDSTKPVVRVDKIDLV
ncbi:hypothetical protein K488DRAFT_69989 [Vararia minispora EC-137]|uniref:Uncharacterized protein n=1 Tax=Vararia minispora EC-137 TaxID=1314806 RepID=A0ACB8QN63_9AGAM|nr:hypothetical protein K488DRAFT_69989 [Vararia minispora EC-137]